MKIILRFIDKCKIFYLLSIICFVVLIYSCEKEESVVISNDQDTTVIVPKTISQKLFEIEGITFKEIYPPDNGGQKQFEILVEQPFDHNNPDGTKFWQTVYLTYVDTMAPVVFDPCGYSVNSKMKSELSDIFEANDIHVGHRFFVGSKPDYMDWQYLTIKQAADDHHRIIELFKPLFKGSWISAGGSKSGITTLFHRRFYPNDVDASVAFVAPISRQLQDPRYVEYIHNLGTEEEQTILKDYQRGLLLRRDEIIPKVDSFINTLPYTFSLTASQMLENEAFTFSFAYWQYYGSIGSDEIPRYNSSVNEYYQFFEPAIVYLSDQYLDYYRPSYYQRFTEIGDFKPDYEYIEDLLVDFPEPNQIFKAPQGVEMTFDPSTVDDIVNWLENEAINIIYIYGALDPWTAGQVDISNNPNCLKIIAEGQNHTLRIEDISESTQIIDSLTNWINVDIK